MRHFGHHKDGKNEIIGFDPRARPGLGQGDLERVALIKNPKHRAYQQKNQEQRKNQNSTEGERFSSVSDIFASQDPLNNQLLGAMRGQDHDCAANYSHPEIEGRAKQKPSPGNSRRRERV